MRRIDADELANKVADLYTEGDEATEGDKVVNDVIDLIDNAPTIDDLSDYSDKLWKRAYERGKAERPHGECRTCKYYHPYFEQLTNIPRGDGYCVIARMTPEGMTTINCNDEFGCSDYQEKQGVKD